MRKQEKELASYEVHRLSLHGCVYKFHTISDSNDVTVECFVIDSSKLPVWTREVVRTEGREMYRVLRQLGARKMGE